MLMDFPLRHTITLGPSSWWKESKSQLEIQRCDLIGNSFQCGVLAWLLGHWAVGMHMLVGVPTLDQMRSQAPGANGLLLYRELMVVTVQQLAGLG